MMPPQNQEQADDPGPTESCSSTGVRMHRLLLYLQPRCAEREYFGQLETLDLINCIIAPLFFANALALWTRGLLSTIYCVVLLIKGYQMALLLLPNARSCDAHKHARYWLILAERMLRQFVATPLLGRGPRFIEWLHRQAADASRVMFCLRLLLLMSGFTISFWNAFCLPLDFASQLAVTVIFWGIHFPPNVTQIAFAFQNIQQQLPSMVMLQLGLERALGRLLRLLLRLLPPVSAVAQQLLASGGGVAVTARALFYCEAASAAEGAASSGFAVVAAAPSTAAAAAAAAVCVDPVAAAAVPPGRAPDVSSVAGRAILAASSTYMMFAVLLLPLYTSWRVERHLKSKWMATLPADWLPPPLQQQQQEERPEQERPEQERPERERPEQEQQQHDQQQQQQQDQQQQDSSPTGAAAAGTCSSRGQQQATSSSRASSSRPSRLSSSSSSSSGGSRDAPATVQQHQQQQGGQTNNRLHSGKAGKRLWWSSLLQLWGRMGPCLAAWLEFTDAGSFVWPPVVFDVLPPYPVLARHLGLMLLASLLFGQAFVLMCMLSPWVAGLLWQQIIY